MVFKWWLGLLFMICVTWNVQSQPVPDETHSPIMVLITCMSVLNVVSTMHKQSDHVVWMGTAHHIHEWLKSHVPEQHHAHMQLMQHVIETHVMLNWVHQPDLWEYWVSQARSCEQALVNMMSDHT